MPLVPKVDIVVPCYCEESHAIASTAAACLRQRWPVGRIIVVDDASPTPVCRSSLPDDDRVEILRMSKNRGIAAARNAGLSRSTADVVACVNVEVVPPPMWLGGCVEYLSIHPQVGATFGRIISADRRLLARWRMLHQEERFMNASGAAAFAPGHAVVFRRAALRAVSGYDERFMRIYEDFDVCERMRSAGWETHYVADAWCVSIQRDDLRMLARKQLVRHGHDPERPTNFLRLLTGETRALGIRLARDVIRFRFGFIPIDVLIWAFSVAHATRPVSTDRARAK